MGYSIYLHRPIEIDNWDSITKDTAKLLDYCQETLAIDLTGDVEGNPHTKPIVNSELIEFNGSNAQKEGIWTNNPYPYGIKWPSDVYNKFLEDNDFFYPIPVHSVMHLIRENDEDNDCSFKTVTVERILQNTYTEPVDGLYLTWSKPALTFPYQIPATVLYLIIEHHDKKVKVEADYALDNWYDGAILCQYLFGYGCDCQWIRS